MVINYAKNEQFLAPYATHATESRGRLVPETHSSSRSDFQRDRDRIIHSGAFRKLRNKTQVFIENEGDYYRTRLTHSLEVAQIARSVARAHGLNEDLSEAIALAHDLGHSCFGHMGENALTEELKEFGGFDHNEQTFRILTVLEHNYVGFDGLNLTWETLEGIAKHNGPLLPLKDGKKLPPTIEAFNAKWDLELKCFAGPEAQIAAIADDIAYNTHDMDDGYRAGLFALEDLSNVPLFGPTLAKLRHLHPEAPNDRLMHEAVRDVIGYLVDDLFVTMQANFEKLKPRDVSDIYHASAPVAGFSVQMAENIDKIRAFLWANMYRHNQINTVFKQAAVLVKDVFRKLFDNPELLPTEWYEQIQNHNGDQTFKARLIADYVAGMTDPFVVLEHQRLFPNGVSN